MSESRTEPVIIKTGDSGDNTAELYTRSFTSSERMVRAGKLLGICWVLALITLFIPIAHFFLVPLFLIAGPVTAYMKYKVETVMEKVHGDCPACAKSVDISLDPTDALPKHTYCPECNTPVQLLYDDASSHQ